MRRVWPAAIAALIAACAPTGSDRAASTSVEETTTPTIVTTTSITATTTSAPSTTTSTSVEIPAGWTVFEGEAVSIAAPAGWTDATALAADPAAVANLEDEALRSTLASIGERTLAAVDLLLIDDSSHRPDSLAVMNLIVAPIDPLTDLVAVDQVVTARSADSPWQPTSSSIGEVAGVETLVVDYTVTLDTGAITARQYHQIRDRELLSMTFLGNEREPGIWRGMAATASSTD